MSLLQRVRRVSRPSSISFASFASFVSFALALTACAGGSMPKASIGAPSAEPVATRTGASYGEPGHAQLERGDRGPAGELAPERPGLGTSWGEAVSAPISFEPFVRAAAAPWAELVLHYNDAAGVRAHAQYLGVAPEPLEVRAGDGALSVALVDEAGRTLPGYAAGNRTLVLGEDGARYRIVVHNQTAVRFEVVTSVDGLDVIDGQPADPNRRGYLIDPHGTLAIDGFRTSDDAVAAFRFGKVAESYAAQTSGDRNVGVVGLAIFAERGAERDAGWRRGELDRRDSADPFPQRGYAAPPR